MVFITEEKRKELNKNGIKIPYVNDRCIGCTACVAISSNVFDINEDGVAQVKELKNYENLSVEDCISACPVNAISWE